ncbi:hypothetical protein JHK86_000811 [Glycine max]|nr:hypothetical protein JHK86_000811 [Glycine max]
MDDAMLKRSFGHYTRVIVDVDLEGQLRVKSWSYKTKNANACAYSYFCLGFIGGKGETTNLRNGGGQGRKHSLLGTHGNDLWALAPDSFCKLSFQAELSGKGCAKHQHHFVLKSLKVRLAQKMLSVAAVLSPKCLLEVTTSMWA